MERPAGKPFEERLDKARAGQETVPGQLLAEQRSWLKRMAERAIGPRLARRQDASDLVQDCLITAQQHIDTFRGQDEATFRGWLKGIQRNLIARLIRRHAPKVAREAALPADSQGGVLLGTSGSALEKLSQREQIDWLRQAIGWLEEDDRRLLERKYLAPEAETVPYDDLAREFSTNAANLRQRVCRLLNRLETGIPLLQKLAQQRVASHYRDILCWRHFRSWTAARMATELGCSERAVKQLLEHAQRQISSSNLSPK